MAVLNRIDDPAQAAGTIHDLFDRVRKEGRQVLVVVGAGCSHAAGMPLMSDVYRYLENKLNAPDARSVSRLDTLRSWLKILASKDGGPRSIAARALGLFQQPQLIDDRDVRKLLVKVWDDFAVDFLQWGVSSRPPDRGEAGPTILSAEPTQFHRRIAEWVVNELAVVVSLNFDGLTRAAIESTSKQPCVILAKRKQIDGHWLGENASDTPIRAVVKVWGDVFHAKCRNGRCPAHEENVALYDLRRDVQHRQDSESDRGAEAILACPDCGARRQLEVFFTGYQQKEEDAERVLDAIRERVMTRVGGIMTIGVSGMWDAPLVRMLGDVGRYCQSDDAGDVSPRVLCLDRRADEPFLAAELRHEGVRITHIALEAERVAEVSDSLPIGIIGCDPGVLPREPPFGSSQQIAWAELLFESPVNWPQPIVAHVKYESGDAAIYKLFGQIRQLGLKTALVRSRQTSQRAGEADREHNRLVHSNGVACIALAWLNALLDRHSTGSPPRLAGQHYSPSLLRCVVFLAGLMHDLNHLPFTHLTEEVFDELHWTTSAWSDRFRHDRQILMGCHPELRAWAEDVLKRIAGDLEVPEAVLRNLVARAIEGRSGIDVLDAIVNSPIDADKVEYLASDCLWMEQEVHLPIREPEQWKRWLETFFEQQEVLPSGLLGISGAAADRAHQLLVERRWLYKYLYFRPGFRVVERIVRHLLVRWLTWHVGRRISQRSFADEAWHQGGAQADPVAAALDAVVLDDTRAVKGSVAATLLWRGLMNPEECFDNFLCESVTAISGEPRLALLISATIAASHKAGTAREWYESCNSLLKKFLLHEPREPYADFERSLQDFASWSPRMYIRHSDLKNAAEIIRALEFTAEPSALIDLAPMPPFLSYPSSRRVSRGRTRLFADCWVVPNKDPDRWGKRTGAWVPLARTALARRDENRWVQVLVVSPKPHDHATLKYVEDRFRLECGRTDIQIEDEDPEGADHV